MAPVVLLPSLEMSNLPDYQQRSSARWADIEDVGTPSPWTDYPVDFKISWPDTPTPCNRILDEQMPTKNASILPQASAVHDVGSVSDDASLQPLACAYPPPASASWNSLVPSDVLITGAGCPTIGPYLALAQPCPAHFGAFAPHCDSNLGVAPPDDFFQPYSERMDDLIVLDAADALQEQPQAWTYGFVECDQTLLTSMAQWPGVEVPEGSASSEGSVPSTSEATTPTSMSDQAARSQEERHNSGQCRPCAWFWKKGGCRNAETCAYCHLCPEGELKSRKKSKITALKLGALTPVNSNSRAVGRWGLKLHSLVQDSS